VHKSRRLLKNHLYVDDIPLLTRIKERVLVHPFTDCWLWQGALNGHGYGQIGIRGSFTRVHRAVWQDTNGPIPAGMVVMHTCDVRHCCNPDHIRMGTQTENIHDMVLKGRGANRYGHYGPRVPKVRGR
jgi:hypothetical protein